MCREEDITGDICGCESVSASEIVRLVTPAITTRPWKGTVLVTCLHNISRYIFHYLVVYVAFVRVMVHQDIQLRDSGNVKKASSYCHATSNRLRTNRID